MKKLTLSELSATGMVISDPNQLANIAGGDRIYLADGFVENYSGYSVFTNNNGTSFCMDGVTVSQTYWASGAYQLNGVITLDNSSNWSSQDLAHEYGHYIQQQSMGLSEYLAYAGISAYDAMTNPNHLQHPWELQASNFGYSYIASNYPTYTF